jgi:K+-transporting ATPase ATPase C chain
MKQHLSIAVRMTVVMFVLVTAIYPAIVWAIGQVGFRDEANGSLITRDGRVIGSSLIGQPFTSDRYFHPRPLGVSNLGPTSRKLRDRIAADVQSFGAHVPADAVTTSASGVDPHISPDFALLQVSRVARSRGIDEARIRTIVNHHIEHRFLGVYGEPRVNVLLLNLALDDIMKGHAARS